MSKVEFIDQLRAALSGKATTSTIEENIRYYDDYISGRIRNGEAEEDVVAGLGDPRLLAKTIVEAGKHSAETEFGNPYTEDEERGTGHSYEFSISRLPAWAWILMGVLIIGLILSLVFSVVSLLMPVIIPILIVLVILRILQKK